MPRAHGSRCQTIELDAPLSEVLPLFTAEGERAWVPGWSPEILGGDHRRGCAFRTRSADGTTTTWICCRYDEANGSASYARLAHGSNIGLVDVDCTALSPTRTRVDVTYTLTALNEDGDAFVRNFLDEAAYRTSIESWKSLLDSYFAKQVSNRPAAGAQAR